MSLVRVHHVKPDVVSSTSAIRPLTLPLTLASGMKIPAQSSPDDNDRSIESIYPRIFSSGGESWFFFAQSGYYRLVYILPGYTIRGRRVPSRKLVAGPWPLEMASNSPDIQADVNHG